MVVTAGCQQSNRHQQQEADATKQHGSNSSLPAGPRRGAGSPRRTRSSCSGPPSLGAQDAETKSEQGGSGRQQEAGRSLCRAVAQALATSKKSMRGLRAQAIAVGRNGSKNRPAPGRLCRWRREKDRLTGSHKPRGCNRRALSARQPVKAGGFWAAGRGWPLLAGSRARAAGSTAGPTRLSGGNSRGGGNCCIPSSPARSPGPGRRTAGEGSWVSLLFSVGGSTRLGSGARRGRHRTRPCATPPRYDPRPGDSILFSAQELFHTPGRLDCDAWAGCRGPVAAASRAGPDGRAFLAGTIGGA
jgi:hypothetical protein